MTPLQPNFRATHEITKIFKLLRRLSLATMVFTYVPVPERKIFRWETCTSLRIASNTCLSTMLYLRNIYMGISRISQPMRLIIVMFYWLYLGLYPTSVTI